MSNTADTTLSALKLCLTLTLSCSALACAVQPIDPPTAAERGALRNPPKDGISTHPDHAIVEVHSLPTTHSMDEITPGGESPSPTPTPEPSGTDSRPSGRVHYVTIEDGKFVPASLTLDLGDTVEFRWASEGTFGVTSGFECMSDGTFESGEHGSGHTWTVTFLRTGFFPYYSTPQCDVMQGLLVVKIP